MAKTAFVITNKEKNLNGVISKIDEDNVEITWENETSEKLTNDNLDALMESENIEVHEVELEEGDTGDTGGTPAQASIKMHKSADASKGEADGNPKTRFDWIRKIVGQMANMDMTSLTKIFNDQQAMVGGESNRAGTDNSAKNQASIKMHPSAAMESVKLQKDEMDNIFKESELSEETKTKLSTLFETAVMIRLTEEVVRLQETYEKKLSESVDAFTTQMTEDLDSYFNKITEEWLVDNEVAIENSLKIDLTENFLEGLKTLFKEHYVDVPDEKVEVFENTKKELEVSQAELNKAINETIEKDKVIAGMKKDAIIAESSLGLTIPQKNKFSSLIESVEFEDEESFKLKLKTIKEGFVDKPVKVENEVIIEGKLDTDEEVDPMMDLINKSIKQTRKYSDATL